jgi:surface protein
MVFVKNKGDYNAYVRTVFAFEVGRYTTLDQFKSMVRLNLNETDYTWQWAETPVTIGGSTYFVATATYNDVLTPGDLTQISLSQIALDKTATNEDVEAFGETYQILVKSQGIQADGFTDAATALNEGFGKIDVTAQPPQMPFENEDSTLGVDTRKALHYENGDVDKPITTKVTNVVFARDSQYPQIAADHDGIVINAEQNVDVHVYYVEEGSTYAVYFLASDTIYAPKDCTSLFENMTALTAVDTGNWDVSRTETMYRMFKNCKNLQTLDVSRWNTGKVTDMYEIFRSCEKVAPLEVGNWDLSQVTTLQNAFAYTYALTELDVSNWDTGNVKNMSAVFYHSENLPSLDVENWDVGKVTVMNNLFSSCYALENVNIANWNTESLTSCSQMFYQCQTMTKFDASNWNVSNLTVMRDMFAYCSRLEVADFSSWDTGKVTNMSAVFTGCSKLKTIYASELWDTGAVTASGSMFNNCGSLVGGNGTVYTGSFTNVTYARIDTEQTPGYFTYKAANA